jgi:hypothetical protein
VSYACTVPNSLIQVAWFIAVAEENSSRMVEEHQEQLKFTVLCELVDYADKGSTVLNQLLVKLV